MADSEFDILIRFGLSKDAATQAQNELKKIKDESITTGKEGVNQEALVTAATDKTFASKKQLKDMMKQIGHEFPVLGRLGSLALNPIAFSAAALTGAFVILKKNLENIKDSFSGFDVSGGKLTSVGEVEKLAAAYDKMSLAVGNLGTNLAGIKTRLNETQEVIATNAKFFRGLGLDLGTGPEEISQAITGSEALKLYQSGTAKMKAGFKISPESLANLGEQVPEAKATLEKQKERRQFLADVKSGKRSMAAFTWRYGADATMAEAEATESATEGQAQSVIGGFQSAVQRSRLYQEGKTELEASETMARGNVSARRALFAASSEPVAAAGKQLQNADLLALPQGIAALIRAWDESVRLLQKAQEDAKAVKARYDNSSQRP